MRCKAGGFLLQRTVFGAVKRLCAALAGVCEIQREPTADAGRKQEVRESIEELRCYARAVEQERGERFYPGHDGLSMSDALRAIADGYDQMIAYVG